MHEIPPEYWNIQKLMKYIKTGNQVATVVALCCLNDHDLENEINQFAIQDVGGMEYLVNILETKDFKCKLCVLMVLQPLVKNNTIRRTVIDMGIIPSIVQGLLYPARDYQINLCELLYKLCELRKGRLQVRKTGGIPRIVDLMNVNLEYLITPRNRMGVDENEYLDMARSCARALWSLARSRKNLAVMMKAGIVPILSKLLM